MYNILNHENKDGEEEAIDNDPVQLSKKLESIILKFIFKSNTRDSLPKTCFML